MAEREIDRFKVKPSGIFAGWLAARVMVDDNGNVRELPVPGEPVMGQNCISLYKKNDRRYQPGNLITEFCNIETHTNYRVYAQDCSPYAYVQTDLNAPKCGWTPAPDPDPLPSPANPPLPFGTASYGAFKKFESCDNKGVPVLLKIFKRNFNGVETALGSASGQPIVISWKNTEDDKLAPIRSTECAINLISTIDFGFQQFYTEDEREYRVEVYKAGQLKFKGFLVPTDAQEDFRAAPYGVTLRAVDSLGALKKIIYPVPVGSSIDIRQNFIEILAFCLAMTNLDLNIVTCVNLYATGMKNGIDDDPLQQAYVNPFRFSKNGVLMDCYTILQYVCKQFGAFLVQDNGEWRFQREAELSDAVLRTRRYTYKAFFLSSEQYYNARVATCKGNDISILDDNPTLRIGGPYKRVEVRTEFGDLPAIIYNGDFELWDGQNFNYWTRYGGIKVSQVATTIKTTTGEIPTGSHAMQFDEKADNSKYIEAVKINAMVNDKFTFSYNLSKTIDTQITSFPKPAYLFKMRIKFGEYYLTNEGDQFKWVKELAIVTNFIENHAGDISNYKVSFAFPPLPLVSSNIVNGSVGSGKSSAAGVDDLTIQLYGFQKIVQVSTSGGARPNSGASPSYVDSDDYMPISIDNLTISKSSNENKKEITSELHISQQDGFYTTVPDQVELLFGDYLDRVIVSSSGTITTQSRPSRSPASGTPGTPTNPVSTTLFPDLYAIYYNGAYTKGWYEYGKTSSPLPMGIMVARGIMKAYQLPYRYLSSSFDGNNFSYLDVFNVNLPNNSNFNARTFALLSGSYDLFNNQLRNATYVEIFEKPAKTIDVSIPSYPGDPSTPIIQNPNPTPAPTAKIFTNQFTDEFK